MQTLIVDGQERGQLEWEDSAIGTTLVLDCPCPQAQVSSRATRVCAGEIGLAGQWMEADVTECQFSSLAWELCNSQVSMASHPHAHTTPNLHLTNRALKV